MKCSLAHEELYSICNNSSFVEICLYAKGYVEDDVKLPAIFITDCVLNFKGRNM